MDKYIFKTNQGDFLTKGSRKPSGKVRIERSAWHEPDLIIQVSDVAYRVVNSDPFEVSGYVYAQVGKPVGGSRSADLYSDLSVYEEV